MISVSVHKNNITQTDNCQFTCEIFRSCLYDLNQSRSTAGFQTFDTGPFLLLLQKTIKKIHKALKIFDPLLPGVNKRAYIHKQTCSLNLQVWLSVMTFWYLLAWKCTKKSKDTYQKLEPMIWIYYALLLLHFFYTVNNSYNRFFHSTFLVIFLMTRKLVLVSVKGHWKYSTLP